MELTLILNGVLVLVFLYVAWQSARVAKIQYGGKFTSSGPYFAAGMALLFLSVLVRPFFTSGAFGLSVPQVFISGVIELGAGVLLLKAGYDYYNIVYTTTAFDEVMDDE